MRESKDSNNYVDWLHKAEEDELSLRAVLKGGAPSTACFLAQQIVEKLLKALLVFYEKPFPRIHDLVALAALVETIAPRIKEYKANIEFLSLYYAETRYPGDYPEITRSESEKAFNFALEVKEFVLKVIKENSNVKS